MLGKMSVSDSEEKKETGDRFFDIPRVKNPIVEENLPVLLDGLDELAEFLSNGVREQFVPPVFFTADPPEYFESAESKEMTYWNTAMCSGLGGGQTLDERCLFEIRGKIVSGSCHSEVRKVNRILGYPTIERWIHQHDSLHDEIVMREYLLSRDEYRLAVYSLPSIQRADMYDLLLDFFKNRGDTIAETWVREHAVRVRDILTDTSPKRGTKQADPLSRIFKILYPSSFKLFGRSTPSAISIMQIFQSFCGEQKSQDDRREWQFMVGLARCLLRTLFSRGCEPLEITQLSHTLLAQALYVTLHMTGNTDRVTFESEMNHIHHLDSALTKYAHDEPELYRLDGNGAVNDESHLSLQDSSVVFRWK